MSSKTQGAAHNEDNEVGNPADKIQLRSIVALVFTLTKLMLDYGQIILLISCNNHAASNNGLTEHM